MHEANDYPHTSLSQQVADFIRIGTSWESSEEMQKFGSLETKGWKVKVRWENEYIEDTCIGLGVFADEDIPRGTLVRIGTFGDNLLIFNKDTNLPNVQHKETLEYLRNYASVCPCNVEEQRDDMIVWIPGNGINHSENPNAEQVCWKRGMNFVATRDIAKGEALSDDYRRFGYAPTWYTNLLKENLGHTECVFQGSNDYV